MHPQNWDVFSIDRIPGLTSFTSWSCHCALALLGHRFAAERLKKSKLRRVSCDFTVSAFPALQIVKAMQAHQDQFQASGLLQVDLLKVILL